MIEINLLPGAKRRYKRRVGGGLKLPRLGGPSRLPDFDRMLAFIISAWVVSVLVLAWLYFGTRSRQAELAMSIEQAQQDSARYARVITNMKHLTARRDTIAQKLQVIQQIDAGRYVWSHVMDEVSRSLPPYTWLTELTPGDDDAQTPSFQLAGMTGSNFALTELMKNLEASPFLKNVTLISTTQVDLDNAEIYSFMLQVTYEEPPPDAVQTVPLFMAGDVDGTTTE